MVSSPAPPSQSLLSLFKLIIWILTLWIIVLFGRYILCIFFYLWFFIAILTFLYFLPIWHFLKDYHITLLLSFFLFSAYFLFLRIVLFFKLVFKHLCIYFFSLWRYQKFLTFSSPFKVFVSSKSGVPNPWAPDRYQTMGC